MSIDTRDRRQLARHYINNALEAGIAPHPLIEFDFLPVAIRQASRDPEKFDKLLTYLAGRSAKRHAWGPLFDPRVISEDPVAMLATMGPDQLLPVPANFLGTAPTFAEARRALLSFAHDYQDQLTAHLPPRQKKWDRKATQQWVGTVVSSEGSPDALVSVIMPVLNRADIVGLAIESVLAQTHTRLELIVIDDGSTDSTREVVAEFARTDPRVRILSGPHAGVSASRNTGLREATGEYIAFLDSDNTWTRRYLELSLTALRSQPDVIATHAGLRLHGDGGVVEHRGGDAQLADLQLGNSIDLNVLVVRSTALKKAGEFDETLRRWVDYDLILRLASLGRLAYLPFIGCEYDNKSDDGRITQNESLHWQWVVRERRYIDWSALQAAVHERDADRISLITVVAGTVGHTTRSIDHLLGTHPDDLEIIIVDNGSRAAVGRRLVAHYANETRVRYVRLPANNNFALAANYGFALSTGARITFLDSDADPRDGWLLALSTAQRETGASGVQALLVNPDYTVQHAGYAFFETTPFPSGLLRNLTIDDARTAPVDRLTAISATATLYDASTFAALTGFDTLYANGLEDIDFCLRAHHDLPDARFDCVPDAIVVHQREITANRERRQPANRRTYLERWSSANVADDRARYESLQLTVASLSPTFDLGHPSATPVLLRAQSGPAALDATTTRQLRWAIKTGVPCTRGGDRWGDIPFAFDLAQALRAHGQQVVTDRYEAWTRPTSYLDDVILTLRGRHPIAPQPGAFNILWVISRPDLVTVDEVLSYDVVFAASEKWAAWMSERSGRTVHPLLQATSPQRFRPDLEPVDNPDDLIFVGGSHGHEYGRAIVGLAVQADAPVGLWGPGWDKFAPEKFVRDGYLDTEILPNAYASANIVLNDHFEDMAEWGFINNRTFDALACGTPVISDMIEGLEIFEGAVIAVDTAERLREVVEDRSWMPSPEKMASLAEKIRTEHSFDARASYLLDVARGRGIAD